jgi:hypothetical protein
LIERGGWRAEHFVPHCLAVQASAALFDDKEGGLSQRHLASQLIAEDFLIALKEFEAVLVEANRNDLVAGLLFEERHHVDIISYTIVQCLRKRSSLGEWMQEEFS